VITYSGGGERKEGMDRSWKQIESLLAHHTPAEILCSLEEVTRQATDRLHSHTLSVDLGRDAQQLQYCYDGWGGMRDSSEQPSLLHAVEQQLLEAQLSHIRRSVESECARRGAREARATAAHLQNQLLQTLEERYGDGQEGDALELAKLLYTRLDLEVAGSEAALRKLGSICSTLDQARLQRRTIVEELRAKLRKIQEFAQVADSKQRKIQALVAHNSSAKDRLLKQSMELQAYVQQSVLGHHEGLTAAASALRDSVAREVRLFSSLALDRLLKAPSSGGVTGEECVTSQPEPAADESGGSEQGEYSVSPA
jgi:hypothetical protein